MTFSVASITSQPAFGMAVRAAKDIVEPEQTSARRTVLARKPHQVATSNRQVTLEPTPPDAIVFTQGKKRYFADGEHKAQLVAAAQPLEAYIAKKAGITGRAIEARIAELRQPVAALEQKFAKEADGNA